MVSREVLTIQLGHYSNFIGTHWWNIQESSFSYDQNNPSEINHDVLYREGQNLLKQVTYTPRLLIVDLHGAYRHLKQEGYLYRVPKSEDERVLWDEQNVEVSSSDPTPTTPFVESLNKSSGTNGQNFDYENLVASWVDYLVPRFHPRTTHIVKQYEYESTDKPFDVFTYGTNLWNTKQFEEEFSNCIRAYVEECDLMQGFQVLMDSADGFAGLGVSCVQHLRDDYGKSILSFPCIATDNTESSINPFKIINTALCWQQLAENVSLFSPLCCGKDGWPLTGDPRKFEHLTYDPTLKYHTSAILASALDTVTLRYRRKEYPNIVLSDLCADLNKQGRKAAATSLNLPFPMTMNKDLIDVLDDLEGPLWTSLTPSCDISMDTNMQSIALRGINEERLKRPLHEAQKQMSKPAYRCSTVHEMMTLYLACSCHVSATYLTNIKSGMPTEEPYPKIFNNNVTKEGDIAQSPVETTVKSVPVMAGLHSGSSVGNMYESLHKHASKIKNVRKYHAFADSGLEQDDFKECLNHLLDCKEIYEDHYI